MQPGKKAKKEVSKNKIAGKGQGTIQPGGSTVSLAKWMNEVLALLQPGSEPGSMDRTAKQLHQRQPLPERKASLILLKQSDLSALAAPYIGETEKNLARQLGSLNHKDRILFFDEADALFGRRTTVSDAHDKFAHTETEGIRTRFLAYTALLQGALKPEKKEGNRNSRNLLKPFPPRGE